MFLVICDFPASILFIQTMDFFSADLYYCNATLGIYSKRQFARRRSIYNELVDIKFVKCFTYLLLKIDGRINFMRILWT